MKKHLFRGLVITGIVLIIIVLLPKPIDSNQLKSEAEQQQEQMEREENAKITEEYYVNSPKVPNFAYIFDIPPEKDDVDFDNDGTLEFHYYSVEDIPADAISIYIEKLKENGFVETDHAVHNEDNEFRSEMWSYELQYIVRDDIRVSLDEGAEYVSIVFEL